MLVVMFNSCLMYCGLIDDVISGLFVYLNSCFLYLVQLVLSLKLRHNWRRDWDIVGGSDVSFW